MDKEQLEKLIEERFVSLTPKLKTAARYVMDSPTEIAMQSMRTVAANAGLQPASMLRFARELGFNNYEDFRSIYMRWLSTHETTFVKRAVDLRQRSASSGEDQLLADIYNTEMTNLDQTLGQRNAEAFRQAVSALEKAKHIYILGLRSFFPAAYYLQYVCSLFCDNTTLLTGIGGTFADELRRIDKDDVLVAFSFAPYSSTAVRATEFVREQGATTIAITDSAVSPIALDTNITLLAPNASPSLFPSILPAMAVAQALAALLISVGGDEKLASIARSEAQLNRFNVYTKN
ncbi:MurR/RpiR family transcriptional regulator [Leeia oryzae]|uniref:MurR/RpiR family transcriptional regulator n=1 Tax=Leeia oryzae TaxID=356662 RepID=UPI000379A66E|nr:MurR/RpiR family transcriptional regulator [Leeia oryzae]